jgi:pimeloyl-ACP methyl ester carboxylesterase
MAIENFTVPDKTSGKLISGCAVRLPNTAGYELAVFVPGFLDSQNYFHIQSLLQKLSELGFLAVSFDPVGTWHSAGNTQSGDYSVSSIESNLKTVIKYAKSKYQVNSNRTLVIGHGLGAFIALNYASKYKTYTSGVVAIMPLDDLIDPEVTPQATQIKRDGVFDASSLVNYKIPANFFDSTSVLLKRNPVSSVQSPLLVLAESVDSRMQAKSKAVFDAAVTKKKFYVVSGSSYLYRRKRIQVEAVNYKVVEFVKSLK